MQHIKSILYEKMKFASRLRSTLETLIFVGIVFWVPLTPLCLTFLTVLSFWYYKNHSNLRIENEPEFETHLNSLQQSIIEFRRNKPTMFCLLTSGCLGVLAVIGHLVSCSTVVVTGLILAAIISTKYNFQIIRIEPKDLDFSLSEKLEHDYEIDDEFIPEENENNMLVLERAGELASITLPTEDGDTDEEKSEEIPSDLLIPDSIPEIDESSTDDDENDLLPIVPISQSETQTKDYYKPPTTTDNSDKTIEFVSSHFKRHSSLSNTSSSSEESLSKGLQFPDHTAVDGKSKMESLTSAVPTTIVSSEGLIPDNSVPLQQALLGSSSILPIFVSGMIERLRHIRSENLEAQYVDVVLNDGTTPRLESSDESEFEILDLEECE